jgi:hypothetical protein
VDRRRQTRDHGRLLVGGGTASRVLELERQKQEIRRERDHIMLSLARDLGAEGLAARLGTSDSVTETLLARARERLAHDRDGGPEEIAARRLGAGARWAEADRLYEELGRSEFFGARGPRRRP